MLYDDDADLTLLTEAGGHSPYRNGETLAGARIPSSASLPVSAGKTVAIIGYGSQGHAHALNLKDSGVSVVVGLRADSASAGKAREEGLEVLSPVEAASRGDLVMMLVPDELHHQVWDEISDGIAEGNMLLFGHGFS